MRLLSDCDSRDRPSNVGPSCGAIWSSVCASVSSDWLSDAVSVPAVLAVRSLTASVSEYGDEVRDVGMASLRSQRAAARRLQRQHPLAEQRSGADVRGGVGAERVLAVDGEADQGIAVVEFDRRHRADLDSRHRHVVADGEAAGLGEQRLVAHCGGPGQQPFRLQSDGDDQDDQDDADEAGPDELGSAIFQHLLVHAPSRFLLDPGEDHGAALKVAGAEGDSADVVREQGAVGADARELAVDLGQPLDAWRRGGPCRCRAAARAGSAGRPCPPAAAAAPVEQVGERGGSVVQRRRSPSPIGSRSCGQSVDQLLESVDRAGELVAVLGQGVQHRAAGRRSAAR